MLVGATEDLLLVSTPSPTFKLDWVFLTNLAPASFVFATNASALAASAAAAACASAAAFWAAACWAAAFWAASSLLLLPPLEPHAANTAAHATVKLNLMNLL